MLHCYNNILMIFWQAFLLSLMKITCNVYRFVNYL